MSKIKDLTIEELNSAAEKSKQGIYTFSELIKLAKAAQELKKINDELQAEQYEKLTFWGKVKSVFSRTPVYRKVNKKEK